MRSNPFALTARRRLLLLDGVLAAALAASVTTLARSHDLHGVVSLALIGVVATHVVWHRTWLVRSARRVASLGPRRRRDFTIATALLALLVPMALTGLSLLTTLDRGDDVHTVTGWAFVALAGVHVLVHLRWVDRAFPAMARR